MQNYESKVDRSPKVMRMDYSQGSTKFADDVKELHSFDVFNKEVDINVIDERLVELHDKRVKSL